MKYTNRLKKAINNVTRQGKLQLAKSKRAKDCNTAIATIK